MTAIRIAADRDRIASTTATVSDHRITELDSGVRIVTEAMPSVRSVSLGYWIGTGSRHEREPEAGLSHLIEHLLFKGSDKYASLEIDQLFDAMGAELNAGTGKETTSLYARVIDAHLADAFDVMSEMVWRPAFRDIDSEREVILEEIAMYEDDPQDKVFDVLGEAVFGDAPAGPRDHRHGGGRRGHAGRADRRLPQRALRAAQHRDRGRRRGRSRRARRAGRSTRARHPTRSRATPRRSTARSRARCASSARTPSSTTSASAGWGSHATTSGASRCACSTRSSAGPPPRASSRRCASSAGSPMRSRPSRGQYADTGQVGLYVGTRPDNLAAALEVIARELERLRREPASAEELARAKENLKGRVVLSLESTGARMNRLGSHILGGVPLLTVDELIAHIDAVTHDDLVELAGELFAPERLSVAGIGPDDRRLHDRDRTAGTGRGGVVIRVAVAGAAGKMGATVCDAVLGADDMELTGRADPALGTTLAEVLPSADVVVDFTRPDTALANAQECVAAGVHVVIGTTGFDIEPLRDARGANVFFAPNFAIGAVLMMKFAAEAAQAHGEGGDHRAAPRQKARQAERHRRAHGGADGAGERQAGPPIHSVRLPGIVANQEVILGDVGQTLTIRHDTIDRVSFMPGVLLAVRRVAGLTDSPVVGLEHLL